MAAQLGTLAPTVAVQPPSAQTINTFSRSLTVMQSRLAHFRAEQFCERHFARRIELYLDLAPDLALMGGQVRSMVETFNRSGGGGQLREVLGEVARGVREATQELEQWWTGLSGEEREMIETSYNVCGTS